MLNRWNFLKTGFYEGIILVILAAEGDCETRNDPAGPEPTPAVSSTSESTPASEPGSPPGRLLSGGGTVADVVDRVLPGVVKIISPLGAGTGFIISPDGLVVTNRHVGGGAKSVTIELHKRIILG